MRNRLRRFRTTVCTLAVVAVFTGGCAEDTVEIGNAAYDDPVYFCAKDEHDGPAGVHNDERSVAGIRYSVRTPFNYDPRAAHPLLMVYAAAGQSRAASERFTGLTYAATAAGFIVAYADHQRLSLKTLDRLASIPHEIAKKWCVDPERMFVVGHSDGGTAAAAMAFRADDGFEPAGIAPSAAGLRGQDLAAYDCPRALRVLVFQNRNDELFPGFGSEAATWWAACMQCNGSSARADENGCIDYLDCTTDASVKFCEVSGGHRRWPDNNRLMLDFFN